MISVIREAGRRQNARTGHCRVQGRPKGIATRQWYCTIAIYLTKPPPGCEPGCDSSTAPRTWGPCRTSAAAAAPSPNCNKQAETKMKACKRGPSFEKCFWSGPRQSMQLSFVSPPVQILFMIVFWVVPHCRVCLLYTSPSPRDGLLSRMPSSA